MSAPAWHEEAKALRAQGMMFREISERLGRPVSTVEAATAERDDNARKRRWERDPANKVRCAKCGEPTGHTPGQGRTSGRDDTEAQCLACWRTAESARTAERGHQIEEWWAQGLTQRQIADRLGWSTNHVGPEFDRLRKRGFDLPRRRPYYGDGRKREAA